MAESQDDQTVDALISGLQHALDRLKTAQSKDVKDESGEDYEKPKTLQEASKKAYRLLKAPSKGE